MDSADKFSQKKKKDLVAIVTQFGLMTEEKANRLTKQDLVDFMNEQERRSSDTGAVVSEAKTAGTEPLTAASGRPVRKTSVSKSKTALIPAESIQEEPVKDIPKANRQIKKDAPATADARPVPSMSVTDAANPEPEMFIAVLPAEEEPAVETQVNEAPEGSVSEAPAAPETPAVPKSSAKHRGRPKKNAQPETEDSVITEEILSMPTDEKSEEISGIVQAPVSAAEPIQSESEQSESEQSESEQRASEQNAPDKPAAISAAVPSAKPHAGRGKKHSVIIKPKEERIEIDEVAEEVSDLLRDYREDQESIQETAAESSESATDESQTGNPSQPAHHNRTLRPKEPQQEMQSGVLEIMSEGYGFLRRENYLQGTNDIYVPQQYVRRFQLRVGDFVTGPCRPKRDSDRYPALQYIKEVNGMPPEKMLRRPHFDRLTPIYPNEKFVLETEKNELSTRIIDLIAPIGKGQRGMIVSPPKAGKTILLQKIANAISINNPECKLIVLLIDERPEEVTDMQRSINGEVVYSTFDKTPENHVRITELVLERAMRLVELGQDVIVLLDSITRMSRAYNLTINPTGRTLSGGLDPGALYGPKRFFGAARNIEGGGSLTIIATSLIETGSRMDEVIFEEFKGTGNMEVCLDRKLSEKRIFPAIDIIKSGTRREELLLSSVELDAVWTIRKAFSQLDTAAVTEMIISLLLKTNSNSQFVQSVNVSFNDKATFDAMRGTRLPGGQNPGQNQGGK